MHDDEPALDPLIRLAVGHYQFEAIHPFTDGNGRTGRVLNSLYLIEAGLLTLPVLYLSRYILANRPAYYRLLLAVTSDSAWEPWLLYMIRGIEETASLTLEKISAIRGLMDSTRDYVRTQLPRIYTRELVDAIFEQPYTRIGTMVENGLVGRQTASRYLKELVRIGVLSERKVGRDKLFINTRLLTLLTTEAAELVPFG